MSIMKQEHGNDNFVPTTQFEKNYSRVVTFIDEVAKTEHDHGLTSVDIFKSEGKWYCRVCRGDEKTQPLGPYTERQAQRIQDEQRRLLAKGGTSGLVFK